MPISKPIYDKEKKQYISVAVAIKRNIRNYTNKFIIPKNRVIVPDGRKYKLITPFQASLLIRKKKLKLNRVIGNISLGREEKKGVDVVRLRERRIGKREEKEIRNLRNNPNFIRYVMNTEDMRNPMFLYDFVKNNININGEGKLVFAQDGIVIFEQDLDITREKTKRSNNSISKWWKTNGGNYIGMIDSNRHAWTAITDRDGEILLYYDIVKYTDEITGKRIPSFDIYAVSNRFNNRQKRVIENAFNRKRTIMYWIPDQNIDATNVYQVFRDNGSNTCLFDGIEKYCLEKDNVYTKAILNKLDGLKSNYPNGVNEKQIQLICNTLKINIEVNDIFNNRSFYIKGNSTRINGTVRFINTYLNHLDDNEFLDNNQETEINTYEEMRNIIKECIKNNEYFYYKGSSNEPNKIFTKKATYKHINKVNEIIKKFNDDININNYSIDIKKDKKLYDYLIDGVNYNGHTAFRKLDNLDYNEVEKDKKYVEYDMKQAYSQYKKCKYYNGFPNLMTPELQLENWTVKKCKKYVGYYKIYLRHIEDENKRNIMNELGFYNDKHYVLTSPEIEFFDTFCDFDIVSGSYSFKPFDIELTDDMLKKIEVEKYRRKDIMYKPYALWAGKLNAVYEKSVMKTNITEELAQTLRCNYDNIKINDISKYKNDFVKDELYNNGELVECIVSKPNDKIYWLGHIGGFITAYTRINVLQELLKFNHKQILGFKLDGFIIEKGINDDEINKTFDKNIWYEAGEKKTKCNFGWGFTIYENCLNLNSIFEKSNIYHKDLFKNQITYLTGAGGCGKSHSVLNNLNDTIYLTACWSLCVSKSKEYDIKSMSVHSFIGIDCEAYIDRHRPPNRILIDEITMIDKKYINKIIQKCPYSQIFIAGDIDKYGYYQCAFKGVDVIKPITKQTINFTTNYRCKDDILLDKLNNLRKYMKDVNFNNKKIWYYVKRNFNNRIIDKQYLIDTYDYKKDWVLVSITNGDRSQTKEYTDILKGNKYICIRHTKNDVLKRFEGKNAFLTGDIVYDLVNPNKRFERRDAYTIHGFQGKTIKDPERLFIDLNNIFCSRQLYTALSRVQNQNQIYLIN